MLQKEDRAGLRRTAAVRGRKHSRSAPGDDPRPRRWDERHRVERVVAATKQAKFVDEPPLTAALALLRPTKAPFSRHA